ncbi:hypothetical protein PZB75_04095 [Streptomyces sp. AM 4-1-1]|uniref:hypothetical protein n=1 Tax=Streptomyces sp. AM 4-1-1 TaxID=3028710 RepID=UPI0023B88D68|nr:hypothetical protein [Streptomyces sp. AM 4-1-1]WEH32632.1 hypothetical protein PZB75_04095 [Streptomyces sp. AM 4-1-1]
MQTSELPDLAHTGSGAIHWAATAAAMAAVIAGAGLLQPHSATARNAPSAAAAESASAPAPDADAVPYPIRCGGVPTTVARRASGDLDGDGSPETVAVVRCDAGSGTPPEGVYVLTHGSGATPRIVATLVDPARRTNVEDLAVVGGTVSATLVGYSSPGVPSCCPDQRESVEWRWRGDAFVRSVRPTGQGA